MFSAQDIQELVQAFPPAAQSQLDFKQPHPFLLPNATGDGFVVSDSLVREFDKLLLAEPGRIELSTLGSQLNVSDDIVLQLSQRAAGDVIISRDQRYVHGNEERRGLQRKLVTMALEGLVLESEFAQDSDITVGSIRKLIQWHNGRLLDNIDPKYLLLHHESATTTAKTFIYTNAYRSSIENDIKKSFDYAVKEAELFSKRADDFGVRSVSFVMDTVHHLIDSGMITQLISEGQLSLENYVIRFRPKSYDTKRKAELMEGLETGNRHYIQLREVSSHFSETSANAEATKKVLENELGDHIFFIIGYAVSTIWFKAWASILAETISATGGVIPGTQLSDSSLKFREEITQKALCHLNSTSTDSADSKAVVMFQGVLIYDSLLQSIMSITCEEARKLAQAQWEALVKNPEGECTFRSSSLSEDTVLNSTAETRTLGIEIVRVILASQTTVESATDAYSDELKHKLQPDAEDAFRSFWSDRVLARFQLYRQGVESIEDEKLSTQLKDLLLTHIRTELVPDSISKAQSRGFFRLKRIPRDLEKLSTSLKEANSSLDSFQMAFEKFNGKYGLHWYESVAAKKDAYVQDLQRTMLRDNDGPRLFLTCVLVLLAKEQAGVIYATGKLAPRLLRQLKDYLNKDEFKNMDEWKEKVKTGSLTKEDKESMKAFVQSNASQRSM